MDDPQALTGSPDVGSQPAATPQSQPGGTASPSAGGSQVDRLAELLGEADAEISRTATTPQPTTQTPAATQATDHDINESLREIRQIRQETVAERTEADITKMIGDWKSSDDVLKGVDDGLIRALLNDEARADPRLANAFIARKQNPGRWQKIEEAIRTRVSQRLASVPNAQITADRRAAAIAGAGISATAPASTGPKGPAEIGRMSDAEFVRYKAGVMRGA